LELVVQKVELMRNSIKALHNITLHVEIVRFPLKQSGPWKPWEEERVDPSQHIQNQYIFGVIGKNCPSLPEDLLFQVINKYSVFSQESS